MEFSELTETAWFDEANSSILISIDRVMIEFRLEEFLDFFDSVDSIRKSLLSNPNVILGKYKNEDGETKDIFLPKPDNEDYN